MCLPKVPTVQIHGRERDVCVKRTEAASSSMLKRVNRACMYASRFRLCVFYICVCIQFVLLSYSTYEFDKNAVCTICRIVEEEKTLKRRPI